MSHPTISGALDAVKDEVSFREFLWMANQELEVSLTRIQCSREERVRLLEQIDKVELTDIQSLKPEKRLPPAEKGKDDE